MRPRSFRPRSTSITCSARSFGSSRSLLGDGVVLFFVWHRDGASRRWAAAVADPVLEAHVDLRGWRPRWSTLRELERSTYRARGSRRASPGTRRRRSASGASTSKRCDEHHLEDVAGPDVFLALSNCRPRSLRACKDSMRGSSPLRGCRVPATRGGGGRRGGRAKHRDRRFDAAPPPPHRAARRRIPECLLRARRCARVWRSASKMRSVLTGGERELVVLVTEGSAHRRSARSGAPTS